MTKSVLLAFILLTSRVVWAQNAENKDVAAIRRVMDEQIQAWDKGDMRAFMEGYWRSDSLRFIGSKGIVYGWQPTLERYQKNYLDAASRGTLRLSSAGFTWRVRKSAMPADILRCSGAK